MTSAFPYVVSLANPSRYNYEAAGKALGVDLVGNLDLVATDPVVSFRTAFLVLDDGAAAQAVVPRRGHGAVDADGGRPRRGAGAAWLRGVITNFIAGGVECGMGGNFSEVDRIGYYKRATKTCSASANKGAT